MFFHLANVDSFLVLLPWLQINLQKPLPLFLCVRYLVRIVFVTAQLVVISLQRSAPLVTSKLENYQLAIAWLLILDFVIC